MINISATSLRANLFAILKKVESGEQVVVTHNKKPVAYLKPVKKDD
nr:type II toxin-antitoxin system Phd/YefM family antitoxin [uncultured Desulfobacter sp.]